MFDILKVGEEASSKKLKDPSVINGVIGAFQNEKGNFEAYSTVKKVLSSLNDYDYFSYATSDGSSDFKEAVKNWLFKSKRSVIEENASVGVCSTPGGTGAIFLSVMESLEVGEKIIIPNYCWEPYIAISEFNKFVPVRYSLFNDSLDFNMDEFKQRCLELKASQNKVCTILNDPCNNPTGYSLSLKEFSELCSFLNSLDCEVDLIYDVAYFEFDKDINEVLAKFEMLSKLSTHVTTFICFSASKTFCMYGMRCGAQIIMSTDSNRVQTLSAKSKLLSRTHWSNISKAGISTLISLDKDETLRNEFLSELKNNHNIIINRVEVFNTQAKECGLKVFRVSGGFFITVPCKNPMEAYEALAEKNIFIVPLDGCIRIAICSVSIKETDGLAYKIKEVVEQ